MDILIPKANNEYELIDSGDGYRLEKFGNNIIARPDTNCVWSQKKMPAAWELATAQLLKGKDGKFTWQHKNKFKEPWFFKFNPTPGLSLSKNPIVFSLHLGQSKNIGVFPEMASLWEWMMGIIRPTKTTPQVLNLFGYTGGASLCAAAAGADVCHVDASKSAITWAKQNQQFSKIDPNSIRWIVDDCEKFIERELKRNVLYDAIILDPPAFGRSDKGKVFEFEDQIYKLLGLCKRVLRPQPLFFIFNGYSMGYSATVLKNLLNDFFPSQTIEFGELHVKETSTNRTLPCSLFARIQFK